MEKTHILKTLQKVRENSSKRNFKQSIDLIINLKNIDMKKQANKIDIFTQLHFTTGKSEKICALIGAELKDSASQSCDKIVLVDDFSKYNPRQARKLASDHKFFIAQANLMTQVASNFGRILGSRAKMPNPKAGCVVPPNANLGPLVEKLKKTVRIKIESQPVFQIRVGTEEMKDEEIVDNILTIYNNLVHALPNDVHNFKEALLKTTMGKPIKIEDQKETAKQPTEQKK